MLNNNNKIKNFSNRLLSLKTIIISIVIVIFLTATIVGVGIYALGWQNSFVHFISKIVPYPAIYLDGHFISFNAFMSSKSNIRAVHRLIEEEGNQITYLSAENFDEEAAKLLLVEYFISKWAKENDIHIDPKLIDSQLETTLSSYGQNSSAVRQGLKKSGLTKSQLRKNIELSLMREQLDNKLSEANETVVYVNPDELLNDPSLLVGGSGGASSGGQDYTYQDDAIEWLKIQMEKSNPKILLPGINLEN